VDRVVTLDLHAPQVQGFFKVPVDDLYGMPVLCDAIAAKGLSNLVVVAPDAGFAKKARQWSERLRAPLAIADKRRVDHSESPEVVELIGSVEGRTALIVDDFTISAGTLADAARVLVERGATSVYAAVTHGLLAGPAIERLDASPIEKLFMTDSVETQPGGRAFQFFSPRDSSPAASDRGCSATGLLVIIRCRRREPVRGSPCGDHQAPGNSVPT
jgi:ribose-phosphate pyrophosphokinase